MNLPLQFTQGDTFKWRSGAVDLGDQIYATTATLIFRGPSKLDVPGVVVDGGFDFPLAAAASMALRPGRYVWQLKMVNADGSVSRVLENGQLDVVADLTNTGENFEAKSQTEIDLDNVQLAMRKLINGGAVQEYTIGNRSVKKMSLNDLINLETQLKFRLQRENRAKRLASGLHDPSNVYVRFR